MHLCDYPSLLARWRRGLGERQIISRSFEQCCKSNGLEASLLDVLNIERDQYESLLEGADPGNVSLSKNETAAVRCMSRFQERFRSRVLDGPGLFTDRSLMHRVKRQVVRQTQLGRSVTYLLNHSFANPLLSGTDKEWFFDRLQEEQGCPESPREIAGEPSR